LIRIVIEYFYHILKIGKLHFYSVLWIRIRIGFYPDPALQINAEPDPIPDPDKKYEAIWSGRLIIKTLISF
jgi:hypothetical protein